MCYSTFDDGLFFIQIVVKTSNHIREAVPEPSSLDHEWLHRSGTSNPVDVLHVPEHVPVHQRDKVSNVQADREFILVCLKVKTKNTFFCLSYECFKNLHLSKILLFYFAVRVSLSSLSQIWENLV